jgi:hypothetical protein
LEDWNAFFRAQLLPCFDKERFCFRFNGIQFANALQRFECNSAGIGLVQVEEFAARVRPTAEFGAVAGEGE